MKIAIMGYSGSGKSTLARKLAEKYALDILHFDQVQFLPNWEIRETVEKERLTKEFLDSHDAWVIDGNYSKLSYERRLEEADSIILLLFNRFSCLWRAYRRFRTYHNTIRPDMAEGCQEKFDWEFMRWILRDGRTKRARQRYQQIVSQYGEKVVVIQNQRQLDAYQKMLAER